MGARGGASWGAAAPQTPPPYTGELPPPRPPGWGAAAPQTPPALFWGLPGAPAQTLARSLAISMVCVRASREPDGYREVSVDRNTPQKHRL